MLKVNEYENLKTIKEVINRVYGTIWFAHTKHRYRDTASIEITFFSPFRFLIRWKLPNCPILNSIKLEKLTYQSNFFKNYKPDPVETTCSSWPGIAQNPLGFTRFNWFNSISGLIKPLNRLRYWFTGLIV